MNTIIKNLKKIELKEIRPVYRYEEARPGKEASEIPFQTYGTCGKRKH